MILQRLTRDIQRQVGRIDHAVQEPQVLGEQFPAIVLHQHPLGTQRQPVLQVAKPQQLKVAGRAVENRMELDG